MTMTTIEQTVREQFEKIIGLLPILDIPVEKPFVRFAKDPAEYLIRMKQPDRPARVWVGFIEDVPERGTRRYTDHYGNWREVDSMTCMFLKAMTIENLDKVLFKRWDDADAPPHH